MRIKYGSLPQSTSGAVLFGWEFVWPTSCINWFGGRRRRQTVKEVWKSDQNEKKKGGGCD